MHTYTHKYTNKNTCIHAYTHTHTHTQHRENTALATAQLEFHPPPPTQANAHAPNSSPNTPRYSSTGAHIFDSDSHWGISKADSSSNSLGTESSHHYTVNRGAFMSTNRAEKPGPNTEKPGPNTPITISNSAVPHISGVYLNIPASQKNTGQNISGMHNSGSPFLGRGAPGLASPNIPISGVASPNIPVSGVASPNIPISGVASPNFPVSGVASPNIPMMPPGLASPSVPFTGMHTPAVASPNLSFSGVKSPGVASPKLPATAANHQHMIHESRAHTAASNLSSSALGALGVDGLLGRCYKRADVTATGFSYAQTGALVDAQAVHSNNNNDNNNNNNNDYYNNNSQNLTMDARMNDAYPSAHTKRSSEGTSIQTATARSGITTYRSPNDSDSSGYANYPPNLVAFPGTNMSGHRTGDLRGPEAASVPHADVWIGTEGLSYCLADVPACGLVPLFAARGLSDRQCPVMCVCVCLCLFVQRCADNF